MSDMENDLVDELRRMAHRGSAPHEIALKIAKEMGGITQSTLIVRLHQAFPHVPVGVLNRAGAWWRVSDGGMSDAAFDGLLAAYLSKPRE